MTKFHFKSGNGSRRHPLATGTILAIRFGVHEGIVGKFVAREDGRVVRVRTIYRPPLVDRWGPDSIMNINAVPFKSIPSFAVDEVESVDGAIVQTKGEDVRHIGCIDHEFQRRNFKITLCMLDKHGCTESCFGCDVVKMKFGRRSHNNGGGSRFATKFGGISEGKRVIDDSDARVTRIMPSMVSTNGLELKSDSDQFSSESFDASDIEIDILEAIANVNAVVLGSGCSPNRIKGILRRFDHEFAKSRIRFSRMLERTNSKFDVAEVCSFPRVNFEVAKH